MALSVTESDLAGTGLQPAGRPIPVVPRQHLLRALDQATTDRLPLLIAPAGYGKIMLLSQWLGVGGEASPEPVLWYTPSEMDNDPAHLLSGLVAEVHARLPNLTLTVDPSNPLAYALSLLFQQREQVQRTPESAPHRNT